MHEKHAVEEIKHNFFTFFSKAIKNTQITLNMKKVGSGRKIFFDIENNADAQKRCFWEYW